MPSPFRPGLLSFWLLLAALLAPGPAPGQGDAATLLVGVKEGPPFVMQDADGRFDGITIELWEGLAAELGLAYELRAYELEPLLEGLAGGSIDVGLGALTVTAERESHLDFSHPFFSTGLGIAVDPSSAGAWSLLRSVVSGPFLSALLALSVLLLATGALVWLLEHQRNPEQFGGGLLRGLGSGFWWSAVTMTTVGYGDKAPQTLGGRIAALVWMFTGIIIISSFTAAITSALTVSRLGSIVEGPEDLPAVRVGAVAGTTSELYAENEGINARRFESPEAMLAALAEGRLDAAVHDWPILRHLARTDFAGRAAVLPNDFNRQDYAIALAEGSDLRENLNRVLLDRLESEAWQRTLNQYLGRP